MQALNVFSRKRTQQEMFSEELRSTANQNQPPKTPSKSATKKLWKMLHCPKASIPKMSPMGMIVYIFIFMDSVDCF